MCAFNVLVGLALAEICSAYPTSGGVYFYAYKLGGTLLAARVLAHLQQSKM